VGTEPALAVAARDALGTDARVAVWPPDLLSVALDAVDRELGRLDQQASRFRGDSEISRIHASPRRVHTVSRGLAEAIGVALAAARWTGGLTDPTVGAALAALGYDRDFASVGTASADAASADAASSGPVSADPGSAGTVSAGTGPQAPGPVPGWHQVRLRGRLLRLPAGIRLDLGATGKGLGADRAAAAAWRASGRGGVLVSLGGDIAVTGPPPPGGWPVAIADSSLPGEALPGEAVPDQVIRLAAGAVATSSVTCRQWRRGGQRLHHIVDPRTGYPAAGPWRTVSVAAPRCAAANAAATAAIVAGPDAAAWLARTGLPARLVGHDGVVRLLGGWPGGDGGALPEVTRG
jgi:thiamine biosynthesis lipoprotein